ncbi:MAG: hypothetical protein H6727_07435 [Myxococcales bacterium]|nr:hypothetical protein [Myxococcales bacterium]
MCSYRFFLRSLKSTIIVAWVASMFFSVACDAPVQEKNRFDNGLVCTGTSGDDQCKGLFCWRFKKDEPKGDGVCSTVCDQEGAKCENGGVCRKGLQADAPDRGYCVIPCQSEQDCAPTLGCQQINNQGEKLCWRIDTSARKSTNGSKCNDAVDCLGGQCIRGFFEGGIALCSELCTNLGDPCANGGVCAFKDTVDGTEKMFCLIECQDSSTCPEQLNCNAAPAPSQRKYCGLAVTP